MESSLVVNSSWWSILCQKLICFQMEYNVKDVINPVDEDPPEFLIKLAKMANLTRTELLIVNDLANKYGTDQIEFNLEHRGNIILLNKFREMKRIVKQL